MMFPDQKNTVTDKYGSIMHDNETGLGAKNKLAHMSLGYINNNGEDRTRVLKTESGMNGMGLPAYNQYDGVKYYLMSEFMNIFVKMNQSVLVTQSA